MTKQEQECMIHLDKIVDPYTLSCAHTFCTKCIQDFCKIQLQNKNSPLCPLCMSRIEGPWLQNILRQEVQPDDIEHRLDLAGPVRPTADDYTKPHAPVKVPEERKVYKYFCTNCLKGEGQIIDNPTKAVCTCGYEFCIDCFHEWGNSNRHICRKEEKAQCPKCYTWNEFDKTKTGVTCIVCDKKFCRFCKANYWSSHPRNPFFACGTFYSKATDCYIILAIFVLIFDILLWPSLVLIAPFRGSGGEDNTKKPCKCCSPTTFLIFSCLCVWLLVFIGLNISFALLFLYPCLAYRRYNLLSSRAEARTQSRAQTRDTFTNPS
ncbi:unnamed protein product [Moneuplotes crassus]|uniref:RING-type domain-containing protein n=1 Tax=Euplotes crassus TaxID=5936 RepID=A0AAD1UJ29_EUPCR|nr:unnamed protein product [Moneuplotes crassus]